MEPGHLEPELDESGGEVIAGEGAYDVQVGFADDRIAICLVSRASTDSATRTELTRENALRLSIELELAAGSLTAELPADDRRRGPVDRRRRR
jgi:hypothetical protein